MSEITKIFIGNLPHGTKPAELKHVFEDYGVVVECDVMNRCGFVHMGTYDMADSAISALNGIEFRGQQIVVEAGKPKERGIGMVRPVRGGVVAAIRGGGRGAGVGPARINDDGVISVVGGGNSVSGGSGRGRGGFQSRGGNRGRGNVIHGEGLSRGGFHGRGRGTFSIGSGPIRSPNFKKSRAAPYQQSGTYALEEYQDPGQFGTSAPPPKYGSYSRGGGGGNYNNRTSAQNNYGTHMSDTGNNRYQNFNEQEDLIQNSSKYPPRGGGKFGRGRSNNFSSPIGQDRRGFALPPHQQQPPPAPPPHFASDIPNEGEEYSFSHQRSTNNGHNTEVPSGRSGGRGSFRGNRGYFHNDRSGFNNSRGGFNEARAGFGRGYNRENFTNDGQIQGIQGNFESGRGSFVGERGGGNFKRGGGTGQFNSQINYQIEFPPLRGGGGNGFRGGRGGGGLGQFPRQNAMTNRRFN